MNRYYNPVRTLEGAGCAGRLEEILEEMNLVHRKVLLLVWGESLLENPAFAGLLGLPLPQEPPALPLTMESRFCDFRLTRTGRLLYGAICGVAARQLKRARRLPPGAERDNRIKGAVFLQRIFDTNCLRTLSFSAGSSMPWNIAQGMLLLGNGHLLRGVAAMCRRYRVKNHTKGGKNR